MRCAVVSIVIALAFAPQAFAVLRPLFPVKPEPPFTAPKSRSARAMQDGVRLALLHVFQ
jgi:hypothetical protein